MYRTSSTWVVRLPQGVISQPVRGMASAKQLKGRLKTVANIAKITKAMKMVAASKLRGGQNALDIARAFSDGIIDVWVPPKEEEENAGKADGSKVLVVPLTSDRGLCGAVNSVVIRGTRDRLLKTPAGIDLSLYIVGDKARSGLERMFKHLNVGAITELYKNGRPDFATAGAVSDDILRQQFDVAIFTYNKFKNLLSYITTPYRLLPFSKLEALPGFDAFETEGDGDIALNFYEFAQAVRLFRFLRENETAELSSRMNAMGNSSKNASEMLVKLRIQYNRTRQAKITTELIEIISGSVALDES